MKKAQNKGIYLSMKLKVLVVFLSLIIFSFNIYAAARGGGGQGIMTINVTVTGLAAGTEATITVTKVEDGLELNFVQTTVNHLAVFKIPFGGSCAITGGPVPGYIAPAPLTDISLTHIKGNSVLSKSLEYREEEIPVSGITIDKSEISMLVGETDRITATIEPGNASDQTVLFATENASVATVSDSGLITANGFGTCVVTATAGDFSAECSVTVGNISSVTDPEDITASVEEVILLPAAVEVAVLFPDLSITAMNISVQWSGVAQSNTITYTEPGIYTLTGAIIGTQLTATLKITVTGDTVIPASDVTLSSHTASVYVGSTVDLSIVNTVPEGASLCAVKWESTVPVVAAIEIVNPSNDTATIKGIAPGITVINVYLENPEGGKSILDSCTINVAIDPAVTDPAYIVATTEDSPEPVDQFAAREEVFVRGYGLTAGATYYIKVTDKGNREPLGVGVITVDANDPGIVFGENHIMFNLFDYTGFEMTETYSKSYFLSMSKEPDFPSGDYEDGTPKTLVDNFKITSPVPTGMIAVDVLELINGNYTGEISPRLVGMDVILCRELSDKTVLETQYEDYLSSANPNLPKYTDEVKLIGHIGSDGKVIWDTPREPLKIGGYVLLIELPENYISNLDDVNPASDSGELLKEVHIERNETVYRAIRVQKT